jgi:hypothetical protein
MNHTEATKVDVYPSLVLIVVHFFKQFEAYEVHKLSCTTSSNTCTTS